MTETPTDCFMSKVKFSGVPWKVATAMRANSCLKFARISTRDIIGGRGRRHCLTRKLSQSSVSAKITLS
jgi:hypothetical protein